MTVSVSGCERDCECAHDFQNACESERGSECPCEVESEYESAWDGGVSVRAYVSQSVCMIYCGW